MPALQRTWAFDRELHERSAGRVHRFDIGAALFTDSLPRVYDSNLIRIDRGLEQLTAQKAERLAESLQGHLSHRKLVLPEAGERLAGELAERGWSVSRAAVMAYAGRRERDPAPAAGAELVDARAIRRAREEALAPREAEVRRQIADYTERLAEAAGGRVLAAFSDGEVASYCTLFEADGIAEIDEVTTLARFRKRGFGTAVVEAALQAALAARHDVTFLNADDDDWPKRWYERLGFQTIGHRFEVYKAV